MRISVADPRREPNLLWDTVWDGFAGDWSAASPTEPGNRGGLRARAPIETAILLCLMTDRRAEPTDEIPDGTGDPRGWPGDGIATPGRRPLGSRLWLLRRSVLDRRTGERAALYAREALQGLVDQGVARSIEVAAEIGDPAAGRLDLKITVWHRDGRRGLASLPIYRTVDATQVAFDQFSILWDRSDGVRDPLAP